MAWSPEGDTLNLALRIFTLSQMLLLALMAWRTEEKTLAGRLFTPMMLAICSYIIMPRNPADFPAPLLIGLQMAASMTPVLFWYFTEAVFTPGFRLRLNHNLFLLVVALVNLVGGSVRTGVLDAPAEVWVLIPRLISLVAVGMGVRAILRDMRSDLVEETRKIRTFFIVVIGLAILEISMGEIWLGLQPGSSYALFDLLNAGFMTVITFWMSVHVLSMDAPFLAPVVRRPQTTNPNEQPWQNMIRRLQELMDQEAVYREEGLTIGRLARKLGEPEYLLRRAINQGLGYRNFNSYLNEIRVAAAARMLEDPAFDHLKVLAVALEVGYRSLSPFNKAFRERQGVTPSAYRKNAAMRKSL